MPLRLAASWLRVTKGSSAESMVWTSKTGCVRRDRHDMSDHYFEFRNVSKAFDDNHVLKDVNFFVDEGETAVIMGRSGVGKSVSLKLLLGFLKPDQGQIVVAGNDVTHWTEEQFSQIRRRVTMVFQSGALFDSLT